MRKRVDLGGLGRVPVDSAQAGEGVDTVDVHGARTTDSLSARPSERERRVDLVLDLDERVEHWREGANGRWGSGVVGSAPRSTS